MGAVGGHGDGGCMKYKPFDTRDGNSVVFYMKRIFLVVTELSVIP